MGATKAQIARAYEEQPYDYVQGNGKVLKSTLGTDNVNPVTSGLWNDEQTNQWWNAYSGGIGVSKPQVIGNVSQAYAQAQNASATPTATAPQQPNPLEDLSWEAYLAKAKDANKATYDARIQAIADAYRISKQNAEQTKNAQEAYAMEQYAKSNPTYGVNAESLGNAGLARSGYSEYLQGNAYNNKVNGILQAQAAYGQALDNAESQKLNDTLSAQVARNEADLEAYKEAYSGKKTEVAKAEEKAEKLAETEAYNAEVEAEKAKATAEEEAEKQRVLNANKYSLLATIDSTEGTINPNELNAYLYANGITNEEDRNAMIAYADEHNKAVYTEKVNDILNTFDVAKNNMTEESAKEIVNMVQDAKALGVTAEMFNDAVDKMVKSVKKVDEAESMIKTLDALYTVGIIDRAFAKEKIKYIKSRLSVLNKDILQIVNKYQ